LQPEGSSVTLGKGDANARFRKKLVKRTTAVRAGLPFELGKNFSRRSSDRPLQRSESRRQVCVVQQLERLANHLLEILDWRTVR